MMRTLLALLISSLVIFPSFAQTENALRVAVESAFVRQLPAFDAPAAASVFENDSLVAIGRNIDGLWLQVRRPIGRDPLGWINREVVSFTLDVATLPITDFVTGMEGTEPVVDTGIAVLTLGEIAIRPQPDGLSPRLATTTAFLTLPVIDRTPDTQWLRVNFRGIVGWLPQYLITPSQDLEAAPINPAFIVNVDLVEFPLIPAEVQIAQVDRLVAYLQPLRAAADQAARFWEQLEAGLVVECSPIAGDFAYYPYTDQDIRELPELRREVARLRVAVDALNASLALMERCGIYLDREISSGYADAINARGILSAINARMENTRITILEVQPAGSVSP